MKSTILVFMLAVTLAAHGQTAAKPAGSGTKSATRSTATRSTATRSTSTRSASSGSAAAGIKLPPGVPPVPGIPKTLFSLRYQDIKIGTGPVAESNKLYKVHYTGWLASDGHKFDSSYDHPRQPEMDKDGKPVLDADGKPKLGDVQPIGFPQGFGRVIPGWDQGFNGMRIGGKRRLFIPWPLAYGARGRPGPDAAHPGIPPKADLIFDVELVEVTEMPMPANHPAMGGMPGGQTAPARNPRPGAPGGAGAGPAPATPPTSTPDSAPATPVPVTPAPATSAPATPAPAAPPAQPQPK